MSSNKSFTNAKKAQEDEFYTRLEDIEDELSHYKKHFKDKIVLCNCDDPYESNFFKYFVMNFNHLGLKELICTSYAGSPFLGTEFGDSKVPYKAVVRYVPETDGFTMDDIAGLFELPENEITELKGDGSYDSTECLELLKQADIVVTNPPFSQIRDYIDTLIINHKKFLIIAGQNAITYKGVFQYFKKNMIWPGYKFGDMKFRVPEYYPPRETRFWIDETGQKWRSMGNIMWLTNLDIPKRHEDFSLSKRYKPEDYPEYDNYEAINVGKKADIPYDYYGAMGVPITFLADYSPDQFEILDANDFRRYDSVPIKAHGLIKDKDGTINGKPCYVRILIRRRHEG